MYEEGSQTFYWTATGYCIQHAEPERDAPENPNTSELRVPATPLVMGHSLGGGTQAREAGRR